MPRPAVFLDRDGTLIEDREYLADPTGVRLLPGVAEGLSRLRAAGFVLAAITNQSGIGRGWMTEADYRRVADEVERQLGSAGASLDAVYFCPAAPAAAGETEHPDRKPRPGLFLRAIRDLDLDAAASFAVGDSPRDLIAADLVGCRRGILVRTGKPLPHPLPSSDWIVVDDFRAAVATILGDASPSFGRRSTHAAEQKDE